MTTKQIAESSYQNFLDTLTSQYGSGETTTRQLRSMGRKHLGQCFDGVYAADDIPVLDSGECMIVNLGKKGTAGSHWVAIVKESGKSYVYDSFGRRTYSILPSLRGSGNGVVKETENDAEQSKVEENCGQRCIAALKVYKKYGWGGLKHI